MNIFFKIWSSKKFWYFFTGFVFTGSLLGGVLGYIGSKGYFDEKSLEKKYCYIYNVFDSEIISSSMYANNKENAYIIRNYYNKISNPSKYNVDSLVFYRNNYDGRIPKLLQVDILKYIGDSSIVKIRAEWETNKKPFYNKEIVYVPRIALHDTLPKTNNQ